MSFVSPVHAFTGYLSSILPYLDLPRQYVDSQDLKEMAIYVELPCDGSEESSRLATQVIERKEPLTVRDLKGKIVELKKQICDRLDFMAKVPTSAADKDAIQDSLRKIDVFANQVLKEIEEFYREEDELSENVYMGRELKRQSITSLLSIDLKGVRRHQELIASARTPRMKQRYEAPLNKALKDASMPTDVCQIVDRASSVAQKYVALDIYQLYLTYLAQETSSLEKFPKVQVLKGSVFSPEKILYLIEIKKVEDLFSKSVLKYASIDLLEEARRSPSARHSPNGRVSVNSISPSDLVKSKGSGEEDFIFRMDDEDELSSPHVSASSASMDDIPSTPSPAPMARRALQFSGSELQFNMED